MKREEAIERFENVKANALVQKASGVSEYWQNEIDGTIEAIDMAIEALQADAVSLTGTMKYLTKPHNYCEVVRCKNCRHYLIDEFTATTGWCYEIKNSVNEDDFCSYGERRKP